MIGVRNEAGMSNPVPGSVVEMEQERSGMESGPENWKTSWSTYITLE